jgi:hypothetical protein
MINIVFHLFFENKLKFLLANSEQVLESQAKIE